MILHNCRTVIHLRLHVCFVILLSSVSWIAITTGRKPDSVESNSKFADNSVFQLENKIFHHALKPE